MSDPIKEVEEAPENGLAFARRLASWVETYPKPVMDWFLAQVQEIASAARESANTANTHRARSQEQAENSERSAVRATEVVAQINEKVTIATQQADRAGVARQGAEAQVPLATAQGVRATEQADRAQRIADEINNDLTAPSEGLFGRRGRQWVAVEVGGGRKTFNWDTAFAADHANILQPGHHNLGFQLEVTAGWPMDGWGGFVLVDAFDPPENNLYMRFFLYDPNYDEPVTYDRYYNARYGAFSDWVERPRAPRSFIPAQAALRLPGSWKSTCSFSGTQGTQLVSQNWWVLVPYIAPYDMTISHLGIDSGANGSGSINLMVYDSDPKTGVPRYPLGSVGMSWTNQGQIQGQLHYNVTLKQGQTYWFGFCPNTNITVRAQQAAQSWGLATEFGAGAERSAYWKNLGFAASGVPGPLSGVVIGDFTNLINVPIIYFKLVK